MRSPAVAVIGHLVWSRTGRIWAVWRVPETPYVWLSTRRKMAEHSRVRSLLAALPAGESMILSVASRVDPGEVAEAMMHDVELETHPAWVDTVEATLDRLDPVELFRRRHYLCVQLPDTGRGRGGRWLGWWRAASGPVYSSFGLGAPPVGQGELQTAFAAAEELEASLRTVRLERATPGEVRWLYARAVRRGLPTEPCRTGWPEPRLRLLNHDAGGGGLSVGSPSLAPLLDATFFEGGSTDDRDRPRRRRYVRVDSAGGTSYQAFAAVADCPQQFGFPGGVSEWLLIAEQLPFPTDWACRIRAVPNYTAGRAAARHQRELAGQVREYEGDPAGPPPSLAAAMEAINDERATLAANPSEGELQVTMTYGVWAEQLADLEQRVGLLQSLYRAAEYHVPLPTGGQRALFEAMLPGSSAPRVCADYRQYMLPRDLAAGMPFAGVGLGDRQGMLLGASRDAGCARPVLFDPSAGPRSDRDGSIAAIGALGSGKSYLAKRLAATVLQRGGQMLLVDRTAAGEYVRFAGAFADSGVTTQVVTIGAADGAGDVLLDPLRVFAGGLARETALGYLALVCGLEPTSLEAATLAKAIDEVAGRRGRLTEVLGELNSMEGRAGTQHQARKLAMRLDALKGNRFATPVWGDGQSIDTQVDCTVIHLPNLAVPGRDVLLSEHLAKKVLPEQICSLGLLYLVVALARATAYEHPKRFAALMLDEAWALTSTLPGQQLISDMVRDGRKHNAALWIASQHPDDLPDGLRDLISVRFLFGLSGAAAHAGLTWLGVDPSQDNLDLLEAWTARRDPGHTTSGGEPSECLMRDAAGRLGHIQIAEAETDRLHAAFESNPTRLTAATTRDRAAPDHEPTGRSAGELPIRKRALRSGPTRELAATAERRGRGGNGSRSEDHHAGAQRP